MNASTLFIVENNEHFRDSLALEFSERGYVTYTAENLQEVETLLEHHQPDFAIIDLKLGSAGSAGSEGLAVISAILQVSDHANIVVLTGYASLTTAVEAIKLGASNYLTKPISVDLLESALKVEARKQAPEEKRETLARHEREYIEYVLRECSGNITRAAKWLGIYRQSLQRKLRKFTPS